MSSLISALARFAALSIAVLSLTGCVRLTMAWAPMEPQGAMATPALDGASVSNGTWESDRAEIAETLQREIYGRLPDESRTKVLAHRVIDEAAFGGIATYEEFDVAVTPLFDGIEGAEGRFTMAVLRPHGTDGPVPVIMTETFCSRWSALPHPDASRPAGASQEKMPGIISYVFGRYICTPPLEMIMEAGFALAVVSAIEVVPDQGDAGIAALRALSPNVAEDERWGAIAAWGWVFSRMVDVLEDDENYDANRLIAYGHSRYGKAALVAAAFDERIAASVAHQSGTGGASLNRRKVGESVGAITGSYPHWFVPRYASFAGAEETLTYDQHHLLALIAPRPVMLGNARRDVWSDPNGGFKAAMGASVIYEAYGEKGLTAERLDDFRPEDPLAFWMRPGTHGVVEEDWPAFLAFLEAHFSD